MLKYRIDVNKAEREAMDGGGKIRVPNSVWRELREDLKAGKAGIIHGG